EGEGVGAITTSCGFLAKYQQELAAAVRVPVFTSSLLMVPLVHRLLPAGRRVGIMTVNAGELGPEHLRGDGIQRGVQVAVARAATGWHARRHHDPERRCDLHRAPEWRRNH